MRPENVVELRSHGESESRGAGEYLLPRLPRDVRMLGEIPQSPASPGGTLSSDRVGGRVSPGERFREPLALVLFWRRREAPCFTRRERVAAALGGK
jgi:hypothetical protein